MKLETVKVSGLKSVKCFGSSMAFKAKMEKVPGVHGVKTYVGSHTVEVSYDPKVTNAEKIEKQIFVPSKFKIATPDPRSVRFTAWNRNTTARLWCGCSWILPPNQMRPGSRRL